MSPSVSPGSLQLCAFGLLVLAACCLGRCLHDSVQRRVAGVTEIRYGGELGRSTHLAPSPPRPLPIRIATHYPTVPNMVLSREERGRLNASVQEAIRLIRELLAVVRVPANLLLSRDMDEYCKSVWRNTSLPNYNKCGQKNENYRKETCLDIAIPDAHLQGYSVWPANGNSPMVIQEDGEGVPEADFILYVKAAETSKCRKEPSVFAYAAYCKLDQNSRPIAGAVTFCHSSLRESAFDREWTVLTTVHELFHALGFSKDLYSTWLDCSSAPSIGLNCSSRTFVTNTDDQGSVRIYTRSVIQKMQQHFNSKSPELGAPLENGVQPGFPSSHWESRFLQGSIMTARMGAPEHTFIDPITLAALADTGWYQINYEKAQALVWGQGQGERFGLTSTCQDNSSDYFCTGSGLGCHYLHMNKGSCLTDDLLDGCRVYKSLVNGSECWKEENGMEAGILSGSGEIYGAGSRCFFANLSRATTAPYTQKPMAGRCYLHRCVGENAFQVKVQGSPWLQCTAGGSIQVPGFWGILSCPDGRLCRRDDDRSLDAMTQKPLLTRWTSTRPHTGPGEEDGPRQQIDVGISVVGGAECGQLEEPEAQGAAKSIADIAAIPRCHIQNPHGCSSFELCLELWEYSGCSEHSISSLYHRLAELISTGKIQLNIAGNNCTAVSIRSVSGPVSPSPDETTPQMAPGSLIAAALCGVLGAALAGGALGVALYRKVRGRRGRVHAGSWRQA